MTLGETVKLDVLEDTEVKPRGRKAKTDEVSDVKLIVRTINKQDQYANGSEPASVIEDYLRSYLTGGWRLESTYPMGSAVEGPILLFVLVK